MDCRLIEAGDVEPLAGVLARAFRDDPFHRWVFPSDGAWERGSRRSWLATLRWERLRGHTLTVPSREGVAIWNAPREKPDSLWSQIRQGLPFVPIFGRRFLLLARGLHVLERLRPPQPCWHLAVLGTDPPAQGKGVGSALMAPVLARCDAEGLPAYLEASRSENVPYYERHGFGVVGETAMPQDGPVVYRMLRKPRG